MYKCDICGRECNKKISLYGYTLCSKHMHQLRKYGEFKDNNPRSSKDPNEYRICNNIVIFDVYDQQSNKNGEFVIDIEDLEKVKKYRWRKSYGRIVTGNNTKTRPTIYLAHLLLGVDSTNYYNKIDHIDGDPSNNRKSNLRRCTQGQNTLNKSFMTNNTSGIIGVTKEHRPGRKTNWCAEIRMNNNRWHIGSYITIEEAAYARYIAETILFGEFRNTNKDEEKFEMFKEVPLKRREEIERYVTNKINQ